MQDQKHSTPTDTAFGFAALPTLSRPPPPPAPTQRIATEGFRLSVAVLGLALVAGQCYGYAMETCSRRVFGVLRGWGCGEGLYAGVVGCGKFCAGSRSR